VTQLVIYWDTSALLSVFLEDVHSQDAKFWLDQTATNLLSSLAIAEFYACISRLVWEGHIDERQATAISSALDKGPWHTVLTGLDKKLVQAISARCKLRGADLWHLSLAASLRAHLPEIALLTFDTALKLAATSEGLALEAPTRETSPKNA
jgi:uncharacterized protein